MRQVIHQFWIASGIALCCLTAINPIRAQIASDKTLSTTIKTTDNLNFAITGGNLAGRNLFHSFSEFSVPTKRLAFFDNASGVQNIISRVTGSSVSNIDGLLKANGTANLFLLNSNGIIFGENARLSLNGSFVASTASSLKFADGKQFSTVPSQAATLLNMSVPVGLQFGPTVGGIRVQGPGAERDPDRNDLLLNRDAGLSVRPEATLALVGSGIALEGGILSTDGGRIELGSVTSPSFVSLSPTDIGWSLGYSGIPTFENIQLSGAAAVDASGAGGGEIQVQGRGVTLTNGSRIEAGTLGAEPGGTLSVIASESVNLNGFSANGGFRGGLFAPVSGRAMGNGGKIIVQTRQLTVENRAQISTTTHGRGNSGNITLKTGQLVVQDGGQIRTSTRSEGKGGILAVTASESVELIGGSVLEDGGFRVSGLFSEVDKGATGNGGNIIIETGRLAIRDGARISTIVETGSQGGNGGHVEVNASESVELIGSRLELAESGELNLFRSSIFTGIDESAKDENGVVTPTTGSGGNITIETRRLSVLEGTINASTQSVGSGGTVTVRALDSVELVGTSTGVMNEQVSSGIFTGVRGEAIGAGGDIDVETQQLVLRDGARVSAETFGEGDGGDISVTASESVELIGTSIDGQTPSRLTTETSGAGNAGDLRVETGQMSLQDGARVTVGSSEGSGVAGRLTVEADSVRLDNQGALVATTGSGKGGDITLQNLDLLLLNRNGQISTQAGSEETGGIGGSITIDTDSLVALENSDIDANAFGGPGGQVSIDAQGIFRSPDSDITATSDLGPEFSGTIELNTPDVDPSQGLVTLPEKVIDASGLIAQGCGASGGSAGKEESKFIVTGRGGLPPSPRETVNNETVLEDWGNASTSRQPQSANRMLSRPQQRDRPAPHSNSPTSSNPTQPMSASIVEAQGWAINANGDVALIAQAPTGKPYSPRATPACPGN